MSSGECLDIIFSREMMLKLELESTKWHLYQIRVGRAYLSSFTWNFLFRYISKTVYIGFDNSSQVWITGKDTNNFTHKLRSKVDGIIVGRRTAEIDNPRLTVRSVLGPNPVRVIADTNRKLPLTLKLFNDKASQNIVLCSTIKFEDSDTNEIKVDEIK